MSRPLSPAAENYSPLYFLASLGAGGLAVTFFMFLMFWIPHPGQPVPVFEDLARAFASDSIWRQLAIVVALAGIAVFAFLNIRALAWNLRALSGFLASEKGRALRNSNAESQLMAMPLAMAMTVNVLFIIGLVFVPGLWGIVEYLFPVAMVVFLGIGVLALGLSADFLGRVLTKPGAFDVSQNNSFAQMLPAFAYAMIAVGLAAPAAMSHSALVVGVSFVASTFFGVAAIVYALLVAMTAMPAILQYGKAREAAPTLMIVIPIVTVLSIMWLRQSHGLHGSFDAHTAAADNLVMLTRMLALEVVFLLLGVLVLRRSGYVPEFVTGEKLSPGAYALVCPGVALSVLTHFWINKGLVANGIVTKFSAGYWGLTAIAIAFQVAMIVLVFYLNRRHFGARRTAAVPAE